MGLTNLFKGRGKENARLEHAHTSVKESASDRKPILHSQTAAFEERATQSLNQSLNQAPQSPIIRRPSNPITIRVLNTLESCVHENRLDRFYDAKRVLKLAEVLSPMIPAIEHLTRNTWNVPAEALGDDLAYELCKLALYDICIICDDSEAVLVADRQEDMQVCVRYMVEIVRVLGLGSVKFRLVNSVYETNSMLTAEDVTSSFRRISFRGPNGITQALRTRVCEKMVRIPLKKNTLKKPVLAICLLAGPPVDGPEGLLKVVSENPSDLIKFSIAQIGDDLNLLNAMKLVIGNTKHCDCTENYDLVAESLSAANIPTEMSPELWIVKVLLGAIDRSYAGLATDD